MRVFASIQWQLNTEQRLMWDRVRSYLEQSMLQIVTLDSTSRDPFPHLREAMLSCQGMIVIAFERFRYTQGYEIGRVDAPTLHGGRRTSSVWNQVEAAMAYQAGLPLLILLESGLSPEGILDAQLSSVPAITFVTQECTKELPSSIKRTTDQWIASMSSSQY